MAVKLIKSALEVFGFELDREGVWKVSQGTGGGEGMNELWVLWMLRAAQGFRVSGVTDALQDGLDRFRGVVRSASGGSSK